MEELKAGENKAEVEGREEGECKREESKKRNKENNLF